jgi:hypothetical protein
MQSQVIIKNITIFLNNHYAHRLKKPAASLPDKKQREKQQQKKIG